MERRSFFKLFGAAVLPLPNLFTTNTVEELQESTNPHKPNTIQWFLHEEAHRINPEIYKKVLTGKNPWTIKYQSNETTD